MQKNSICNVFILYLGILFIFFANLFFSRNAKMYFLEKTAFFKFGYGKKRLYWFSILNSNKANSGALILKG
jgi:hypothetical protein